MTDDGPEPSAGLTRDPPPRRVRHVIAVGGGRGGVGKSVLTVNLGVYLAQLGRKVVLIDADSAGGELHTLLGIDAPITHGKSEELGDDELFTLGTPVPGLVLSPQTYGAGSTAPLRPGRKARWARNLRQLDADYVLLDLGAGTAAATLDLFLAADVGLCVTGPEPPSVEATYRFCRAAFIRKMRRALVKDRFKIRMIERAQAELAPLPTPLALMRAIARYDSAVGDLAASELSQLRPRLVVNGVRLRTDSDLGPAMCDIAKRYLGVALDYCGQVEHDDAVWLSVVRRRPLLIDSPTSKSARNLERIARRVLALAAAREQPRVEAPPPLVSHELSLYDVLWTHPGASDEELRRAYKRQRDIYQSSSLPLTSLLTEAELKAELARIEEAHETLLDPIRRRAYDLSSFPAQEQPKPERDVMIDSALAAERALLRQELVREVNAETEFTGSLLRKVRESQGVEIDEISGHTKISPAHLRAIEAEDFANLPALVYTRGFVQQIAKYLKLDPAQVTRTYLRRMREWRSAAGGDSVS
jgi:flagellar biosynthesis protein FlhG